jgi:lysozyme family protein
VHDQFLNKTPTLAAKGNPMKSTFEAFLPVLFKHEGGYVFHPRDPGGATNHGITRVTLARWRKSPVTVQQVKDLTREESARIYRAFYWDELPANGGKGGDLLPKGVDAVLFDVGVNSGIGRARKWFPLIANERDPIKAIKTLCARRVSFFRSLSTFDVFGKGWLRRAHDVEAWALKLAGASPPSLEKEAVKSQADSKKAQAGATASGGGVVAVPVAVPAGVEAQIVNQPPDWLIYGLVALFGVVMIVLVFRAISHATRKAAMADAAKEQAA